MLVPDLQIDVSIAALKTEPVRQFYAIISSKPIGIDETSTQTLTPITTAPAVSIPAKSEWQNDPEPRTKV
jgi:hypothetical protein